MEKFDYTSLKNETAVKKQAREDLTVLFYDFLCEEFGKDDVKMVDNNTIGFIFGNVNDKENLPCYVIATIKPIIKNYQDHYGEKKIIKAYDFFQAAEDYKNKCES